MQLKIVVLTVRIFCPHFGQTSFCMLKNSDARNNVGPMANASSRLPVLMPYPETGSQTNQPLYQRSRRGHNDTLRVDFGMRWTTRRKVVAARPSTKRTMLELREIVPMPACVTNDGRFAESVAKNYIERHWIARNLSTRESLYAPSQQQNGLQQQQDERRCKWQHERNAHADAALGIKKPTVHNHEGQHGQECGPPRNGEVQEPRRGDTKRNQQPVKSRNPERITIVMFVSGCHCGKTSSANGKIFTTSPQLKRRNFVHASGPVLSA